MIDSFAPAHLKLVRFPAHSPLPIAALPSMSLSPKPPFARVAAATCLFAHLCPPRRSLGVGGSLDSRRLHSRAQQLAFNPFGDVNSCLLRRGGRDTVRQGTVEEH